MNNRLVFIIPFYNVANYIEECIDSLLQQTYDNWLAIFIDDKSYDNTASRITYDPRFKLIQNKVRRTALPNIHDAIVNAGLNDEDIVCILDGDDKLLRTDVCQMTNDIYNHYDSLVTYGQYITSSGVIGSCAAYNRLAFSILRRGQYIASHLRTFKYKLYKELMRQDPELSCYRDKYGHMYKMTYDVAMMFPLLEIAGFDRVIFNPEPIYYYRLHGNNDHIVDGHLQATISAEIGNKPRFQQAFF